MPMQQRGEEACSDWRFSLQVRQAILDHLGSDLFGKFSPQQLVEFLPTLLEKFSVFHHAVLAVLIPSITQPIVAKQVLLISTFREMYCVCVRTAIPQEKLSLLKEVLSKCEDLSDLIFRQQRVNHFASQMGHILATDQVCRQLVADMDKIALHELNASIRRDLGLSTCPKDAIAAAFNSIRAKTSVTTFCVSVCEAVTMGFELAAASFVRLELNYFLSQMMSEVTVRMMESFGALYIASCTISSLVELFAFQKRRALPVIFNSFNLLPQEITLLFDDKSTPQTHEDNDAPAISALASLLVPVLPETETSAEESFPGISLRLHSIDSNAFPTSGASSLGSARPAFTSLAEDDFLSQPGASREIL